MPRELFLQRLGRVPIHPLGPSVVDVKRGLKLCIVPIPESCYPIGTSAHLRGHLDARLLGFDLRVTHIPAPEPKRDVLAHVDGVHGRGLRLKRHGRTELVHVVPHKGHVVDEDLARGRIEEAREQLEHGGFSAAVGADDEDEFAGEDVKGDVVQRMVVAFWVP